jgi:hypothetical protein
MHLVTRQAGARRGFARQKMLEQVRDVGLALEFVLVRYERLARDIAGAEFPAEDFQSRVKLVNREVAGVATRLQDLFVIEYEARKAEAYAEFEASNASRAKRPPVSRSAVARRNRQAADSFVQVAGAPLRECAVAQ